MLRTPEQAIAWGRAQITKPSQDWYRWCLVFVRSAYAVNALHPNAGEAWDRAAFRHHTSDPMTIPAGVPVHFETPGEADHIVLSTGNGMCLSNDIRRRGGIDEVPIAEIVTRWNATLHGWSEDLNGVRVYPQEPVVPKHYSRADIGLRPARGGPGSLNPAAVEGLAFHWPAMTNPLRGVANVMAALRNWQAYHMDSKGWSDIGYQVAVDQDGNRYQLRGIETQSGANGDTDVNERFGACLLVLAPGEQPTPQMVDEVRQVVADFQARFPKGERLVGHSDVRPEPTQCPGPIVLGLIRAGTFNPDQEDDDMTPEDRKLLTDTLSAVTDLRKRFDDFARFEKDRDQAGRERDRKRHEALLALLADDGEPEVPEVPKA